MDHGSTLLGNTGDHLSTSTEDNKYHRLTCSQQLLHILLLLTWQTQSLTVTVLTTEHHVLTHGGNNHITLLGHRKRLSLVDLLAGIHLTVQQLKLPGTLIT